MRELINGRGRDRSKEKEGHKDRVWHVSRFGGVCVKERWCFRLQALVRGDRAEQALWMAVGGEGLTNPAYLGEQP